MTLEQKRKNRRLAKLYGRLGGFTILYWILQFVVLVIIRNHSAGDWGGYMILIILAVVAPPFISLAFWMVAQGYQGALIIYKNQIKEYRVRKAFVKAMTFIESGDVKSAMDIYSDYIPVKHPTRDYLYSLLIYLMSKSNDPDLVKRGTDRLIGMKDFYSPDKIKF
jgi:hypothetical protein